MILSLLEKLAKNAHHQIDLDNYLINYSNDIKKLFMIRNSSQLKNYLTGDQILADRNAVVNLPSKK